jgi:hypothetical protein
MKEYGCSYYDLCFIEPERLPHIYRFKKGFGNLEVSVPVYHRKSLYYKTINRLLSEKIT